MISLVSTRNKAHALCMLDNWCYRHTLRMCNIYCFSTVTLVKGTRLSVSLYVYCLSCVLINYGAILPWYCLVTFKIVVAFGTATITSSLSLLLTEKCILCNQRDATYTIFFIITSALHVSGGFSAHRQELIKLCAVYRWCGWVPPHPHQR